MTTQIAKQQMCVVMRNGLEIWLDADKAQAIQADLKSGKFKGFMGMEGRVVNSVDIIGIFKPEDLDNLTRRKNGQWQCQSGTWHDKGVRCECPSPEQLRLSQVKTKAIKACGKCKDGWIKTEKGMAQCECIKNIK